MFLPMMGLLFTIFVGGVSCAMILAVVAAWRWLVPFTLIPILAAVGAFVSCWSLVESIGFLTSYVLGGLLGTSIGTGLALLSIRSKLDLPRWRKLYLDCQQRALQIMKWVFS